MMLKPERWLLCLWEKISLYCIQMHMGCSRVFILWCFALSLNCVLWSVQSQMWALGREREREGMWMGCLLVCAGSLLRDQTSFVRGAVVHSSLISRAVRNNVSLYYLPVGWEEHLACVCINLCLIYPSMFCCQCVTAQTGFCKDYTVQLHLLGCFCWDATVVMFTCTHNCTAYPTNMCRPCLLTAGLGEVLSLGIGLFGLTYARIWRFEVT